MLGLPYNYNPAHWGYRSSPVPREVRKLLKVLRPQSCIELSDHHQDRQRTSSVPGAPVPQGSPEAFYFGAEWVTFNLFGAYITQLYLEGHALPLFQGTQFYGQDLLNRKVGTLKKGQGMSLQVIRKLNLFWARCLSPQVCKGFDLGAFMIRIGV